MAFKLFFKLMICGLIGYSPVYAQSIKPINDKHITHQQERMVYKQWDRNKFTPTKGFLGLNYQYWLTWGLHPNYPKLDRRPLATNGPQTLRIGFALAMKASLEHNKLHMDTLSKISLTQLAHITPLSNDIDPLWILYYKNELASLINSDNDYDPFKDIGASLLNYLKANGVLSWYQEEYASLKERLEIIRGTDIERGSRIIAYHRILYEYKKLKANLEAKIEYSRKYLRLIQGIPNP